MFQPICKTSTQIINEDGWVKKTEQGICPSFNRIKKWFQYNAEVNFNYAQVNIKGKIDNFFESNKTFHMKTLNNKSEEFEIMKIESFTATYFYKPIPTKIIYEKTRIKKIYSEEMNSPPPLNRIKFFYIKQLPITFTYTGHLNQTDIDEISGKIKTIDKLERKNSFYLDNGDVLFTSNICGYRTNYEVCEPYPLLESSKNEDISQIKVLLISGSQKFTVNWERLNKLIPNFKSLCSVNPLSKEMLEYDLSHLLDEQQLFLLLKYLNHEIELNQRNAFDLYYIAVLMEMDELKETTEFKATRYLIKKGTRSNIDLIQQQPILKTLLNKFGGKLLNYFQ
ncbi:MAG: hypothetical protein Q8K60_00555, partial [Parachlamydiaceae bacterium]|nr:hypothetical protein [Parachlamydiaceae bacterium]